LELNEKVKEKLSARWLEDVENDFSAESEDMEAKGK
jgi:hypothetical protein